MNLTKEQSRKRFHEMRAFWIEYDPIGVMDIDPQPIDEYDGYCGEMLKLLDEGNDIAALVSWLYHVFARIGLNPPHENQLRNFVLKIHDWYTQNWLPPNV